MPAPISVIIPTLNSARQLPATLGALSEALTAGLLTEVIFADGGSNDDTAQIAEEVGARFLSTAKGRGNQLAAAAKTARGDWMLFLHSDSVLESGWPSALTTYLSTPDKAAYFKLRFDESSAPATLVSSWANFRSKWFGLPYGDQALLINRRLYNQCGGYSEIPLMEDVEIAKKLRGKLTPIPVAITTSAAKYKEHGWMLRSLRNFSVFVRYKFGADPTELAKSYDS